MAAVGTVSVITLGWPFRNSRMRGGLRVAQGLVNNHFQIGLVAQTALGSLHPGQGDVLGVEADGGCGQGLRLWERDALLGEEASYAATAEAPLLCGLLEFSRDQLLILKPPPGLFRLCGEGGNLQVALGNLRFDHRSPAFCSK